jgi:hypothetical protein
VLTVHGAIHPASPCWTPAGPGAVDLDVVVQAAASSAADAAATTKPTKPLAQVSLSVGFMLSLCFLAPYRVVAARSCEAPPVGALCHRDFRVVPRTATASKTHGSRGGTHGASA